MTRIATILVLLALSACAPQSNEPLEEDAADILLAPEPFPLPPGSSPPPPVLAAPVVVAATPSPYESDGQTSVALAVEDVFVPVFEENVQLEAMVLTDEDFQSIEPAAGQLNDLANIAVPAPNDKPFFNVRVSFASNRAEGDLAETDPAKRLTNDDGPLIWGQADVSLPVTHTRGELETPGWLEARIWGADPARHVILQDVYFGPEDVILRDLRDALALAASDAILLYVHGYSTSFEKAARRMAQMKHDLEFDGPADFFSWPSKGITAAYPHDSNMVRVTQPKMEDVLRKLAQQGAGRVIVIAHSMGTQILSHALAELIEDDPATAAQITTVILAAPDIDARVFTSQLAPAFADLPEPVTLYASSNDAALKASKKFNGYDRIGDASEVLRPLDGVVVIDASNVTSDFFGHTYFAESTSILSDIYFKVNKRLSENERRGLVPIKTSGGLIWQMTGEPAPSTTDDADTDQ
jgi:esterase/lipase superfamily enzyme